MFLIIFLCIQLSIVHFSVSDLGYECRRDDSSNVPAIFLINNYSSYLNSKFNSNFRNACQNFYDITSGSLKAAEEYENVIHFATHEYYDGKPLKNFVYASTISKMNETVCTTEPNLYCDNSNETVNLVSNSVLKMNDSNIYNLVQKMQLTDEFDYEQTKSCKPFVEDAYNLKTVLLCLSLPYYTKVNILPLKLIITYDECRSYSNFNDRILAVLAPKPFKVSSEYSVPTIFYETPYMFSEFKTVFPNSMNLIPWRLLKYGFSKFIQTMGWQRVVIVTDDSEYSIEFENELTALFNIEGILYTVIRCEDANCEMDKIRQELVRVAAKIVIGNVEEMHAQYLIKYADHRITWIVRDMAANSQNMHLYDGRNVFSISLRTFNKTKGCNVDDNILTGLSSIAQAYKKANVDYKITKREFFRYFAVKAKQITTGITEAVVVVNELKSAKEISTMYVNATGAEVIIFENPFKSRKPSDGTTHCLSISYDYFDPCEDPLALLLMFVIIMFVTTFLLITCFFEKSSPYHDIRYQNF